MKPSLETIIKSVTLAGVLFASVSYTFNKIVEYRETCQMVRTLKLQMEAALVEGTKSQKLIEQHEWVLMRDHEPRLNKLEKLQP